MLLEEFPFESGFRLTDGDLLNKVASEPAYSVDNAVTGTGTTQATAYNIRATTTILTGGADQTGVRLPPPKVGRVLFIWNYTASGKKVYPYDTETINGATSADISFGQGMLLICTGPTSWSATQASTSTTGDVILDASDADTATGQGHLVSLQGGAGGATSGAGGGVNISGGPGVGTTSGDGGDVTLTGGDSNMGAGGDIFLHAGAPTGTIALTTSAVDQLVAVKASGQIGLVTGQAKNAASGAIAITTGNTTGTGATGAVAITTGDATSTGPTGAITLKTGVVTNGVPSGAINLVTGNVLGASTAGAITLTAGTPGGLVNIISPGGPVGLSSGAQFGITGTNNVVTVTPGATPTAPATMAASGTGGLALPGGITAGTPGTNNAIVLTPGSSAATTAVLSASGTGPLQLVPGGTSPLAIGSGTNNRYTITPGAAAANPVVLAASGTGGIQFGSNVGFNSNAPLAKPTVTGAKGSNAALASLLAALVAYGLVTDTTTA